MDLYNLEVERRAGRPTGHLDYLKGCYFHGFCDDHDDLVGVVGETELEPGIYDVIVYGMEAKLYYWVIEETQWQRRIPRGLVVLPGTEWETDAIGKYERAVDCI